MNKQDLLEWIGDNKGKTAAIVVSGMYLIAALFVGNGSWVRVLIFLIFPLACIFFSGAMGGYRGGPHITKATPGIIVAFGGWILLLSPLIFAAFQLIFGNRNP